jgi:AcrR family transcriptional regulator
MAIERRSTSILSRGPRLGASEAVRRRRAEVEQRIADATTDLLGEGRSFADLGVGEIAARAGIARSAFYGHYADKRELIIRLAEEYTADFAQHIRAHMSEPVDTPRESLTPVVRLAAEIYTGQPHLTRAVSEAAGYDEVVREWFDRQVDGVVAVARRQLEYEQSKGHLPGLDPGVAAYALTWMVDATFRQELVAHQRFDPESLIDTVVTLILRATGADER